jgi:putative flippase GtrA
MTGLRRWLPSWQFVRYLLVGGWNTAFAFAAYAVLTWVLSRHISFGYFYASVISNILSILVSFLGYKWFVFKTKGNYLRELLRCFVVYGAASLSNLLLLPITVNVLIYIFHVPAGGKAEASAGFQFTAQYLHSTFLTAPYIAGAMVTGGAVLFSFFGHKHFSFRQRGTGNIEA